MIEGQVPLRNRGVKVESVSETVLIRKTLEWTSARVGEMRVYLQAMVRLMRGGLKLQPAAACKKVLAESTQLPRLCA